MTKLVRRVAKTVLFIALFCLFARFIDSSQFISLDTANQFAVWMDGHASQENYDDLWFYTDVLSSLACAIVAYNVVIISGRRLRKKTSRATPQH